ncbi:cytochrome D1 domain-containing protein [Pseudomonas sp. X10]
MIIKPEQTPSGSNSSSTSDGDVFESVLDKARQLADKFKEPNPELPFKAKVLATTPPGEKKPTGNTSAEKPAETKPADDENYKAITELPEKLEPTKLKVVAQDKDDGSIYFEHAGNKYKISKEEAEQTQAGYEKLENIRFGHGIPQREAPNPEHGTQLYNLLQTLGQTQGTPTHEILIDGLKDPAKPLLRKDDEPPLLANIKSVEQPVDGILKVKLTSGAEMIVAEGVTPEAFAAYSGAGKTKLVLGEGEANGYKQITAMPDGMNMEKLKVISEDPISRVILFEHDGHKYMISRDAAAAQESNYAALENIPSAGDQPAPIDRGDKLYDFLHVVKETEGTPAFEYIKNARTQPDQHLFGQGESTVPLEQIKKVETPTEGILVVTQADGKQVVVSAHLTPKEFVEYTAKGQTISGLERATSEGYVKAEPGAYLSSTDDIMSVGDIEGYGPGLITFTQHKPGGEEEKIIVSAHDNPQMYDQIVSYRKEVAEQINDVDKLRAEHGLPPLNEVLVEELPTTVKDEDGNTLSVQDLTIKELVDEYREGIKNGSISQDDPRAKFVRALEAKSMADNGMPIIPEHGFQHSGNAIDPIQLTSRDVRDEIFNVKAIDEQINTLLADENIVKDLKAKRESALSKVEGGQDKVDETHQKLLESTSSENFTKYIGALTEDGKSEIATQEVQRAYAALADVDPAKADEFLQNLQIDGYTLELENLLSDPSKISDENTALATTDQNLIILQALKASSDTLPRRALQSYDKFVEMLLKDKGLAADFGKVMASLGDTWQTNGTITAKDIEKALDTQLKSTFSAENRTTFFKQLSFLTDNGVLGSLGGAISLGRAIYQLAGKGGSLAVTPAQRVGITNDFVAFLSTGSHFATLGTKAYDKLMGTNAYKMMGLDRSVPEIWAKPGTADPTVPRTLQDVQKQYYDIIDNAMDNKEVNFSKLVNGQTFDEATMLKLHEGIESGIEKRGRVPGSSMAARIAGSALKVIGAGADVVGGVLSIVTGGLAIRDGIREQDPFKIGAGSMSIAGGVSSLVGGAGSVLSAIGVAGRVVPLLGPVGFLFSGAFSLVGAILNDVKSHKLHKLSMQNWEQIQQFKQDGLLQPHGDEAYVWLQTYLSDWGQRDTPENRSIFEFRREEWEARSHIRGKDRVKHPDYIGDGNNAMSESYKFSEKPSEWITDDGEIVWMVGGGYSGIYKPVENA